MQNLKNIKALVKTILENDERARNSDSFLYFRVIETVGKIKDIDINRIPVTVYLLNMAAWGFPKFESVRRTRQKVQQHNPELAACKAVEKFRTEKEKEYRDFAREK